MRRQHHRPSVVVVLALALATTACSELPEREEPDANTEVTVTGLIGEPPVVEFEQPLSVPKERGEVVVPGTGAQVVEGQGVLVNMYAIDGRDGTVLQNTYTDAPQTLELTDEGTGSQIVDLLVGQRVGARLVYLEEANDVPLVLVVDLLPTRASGEVIPPVAGLPVVTLDEEGAPTITIPADSAPPGDLVVQPLVRGGGVQVEAGQVITVRFTGVSWSSGEVFDSNWTGGTQPASTMIGIGQIIEGWEQGLLEQSVGSQVLLVVPPALAYAGTGRSYADETLVYVVDILDAHFPVVDETPGQEGQTEGQ
ncbi:FKBP-type peptidyl-prolyl cis-trans isomerase [Oerskovia sp. Sa1BUA8]|uniref:Peptidyl-prolyl cis-trans isomerase n=1 Tax=Oerskovia douganii TaxID=2762210 RepID=A0A9D5Z0B4_9CELL|nr:FKBP-type peptidyl-prolyl cis-trans isomerase [Oerskovia douganii]MBE7702025.1 FKBP-type peptidyl-prolyl cis-trans isomerase [Oerskovia douganii]